MKIKIRQIVNPVIKHFGRNIIHIGRYPHGYLFCHDRSKGIWYEISGEVEKYLRRSLKPELLHLQIIKEVMGDICQFFYRENTPEEPPWNLINFTNGIWDIKAGGFIDYREDEEPPFFLSRIPHEFHPEIKNNPDRIDGLFDDWVSPDYKIVLYELAGYCLFRCNSAQKFFALYGPGDNGKTTYVELLRRFVGPGNCSSLSMDEIMTDRFALSSLRGKLINITGELNPTLKRTDKIKLLTGGDTIFAQGKFKAGFFFKPYAKPVFMGNIVPSTPDSSIGFYRRTLIIPFLKSIPPDKRIPESEFWNHIDEGDFQGMLKRVMLEVLPPFINKGFKFSIDPLIGDLRRQWEDYSNPLQGFVQEHFQPALGKKEFIPNPVLGYLCNVYCQERHLTCPSQGELADLMKKEGYESKTQRLSHETILKFEQMGVSVKSPCRGWVCNGVTLVTDNSTSNK